jgi:murein DD-endopeptidase MepM/ murein hydrolase activator NlpD
MSNFGKGFSRFLKNPFLLGALFTFLFYFSFIFLSHQKKLTFQDQRVNNFFLSSNSFFKTESLIKTLALETIQNNTLTSFSFLNPLKTEALAQVFESGNKGGEEETKEPILYKVKRGETIKEIAEKFNISEETILWANDLKKGEKLKEGQELLILPVSGVIHIVDKNETINEIAKRYKADVSKIIAYNELSPEGKIYKGDILIIPDGVMPETKETPSLSITRKLVSLPEISSYFALPTSGIISQGIHWFNAVDIANKCETTPVFASATGRVIEAGWQSGGCGNTVKIEHPNETITVYCHLSRIFVNEGDYVSKGEEIGRIGNTGRVRGLTGCHLHFSVLGAKNPLSGYRIGTRIGF